MSRMSEDEEREGLIQGRMVCLAPSSDSDFKLAEAWLNPKSKAAALTGDTDQEMTAEGLRGRRDDGSAVFFTILAGSLGPVGIVTYRRLGFGSFALAGAVGPEELWSRGFGFDAFGAMIYYLFTREKAARVEVTAGMQNPAMVRMLTNSHFFVLEGVTRKSLLAEGRRYDQIVWSMLREEFEDAYEEEVLVSENSSDSEGFITDADVEASAKALRSYLSSSPWVSINAYTEDAATSRP